MGVGQGSPFFKKKVTTMKQSTLNEIQTLCCNLVKKIQQLDLEELKKLSDTDSSKIETSFNYIDALKRAVTIKMWIEDIIEKDTTNVQSN